MGNQYRATLGDPILKNHTFYFADYQVMKQGIGTGRISTVPTLLERQGNFTELYGSTNPVCTTLRPQWVLHDHLSHRRILFLKAE